MKLEGPIRHPKWTINVDQADVTIRRNLTGEVIFHVNLEKVIFADQFIQVIVDVPNDSLYGFGERLGPHEKSVSGLGPSDTLRFPFFNYGTSKATSSYGSHPFYLMYENGATNAHGVLLLNSNPSDVTLSTRPSLIYRTIGGDIDFTIFMGPDAVDVIRQKASVIGQTPMPPYWALGFHLSKYGYTSARDMRHVLDANRGMGIPVDVQWADIDYMDRYNDFTIDNKSFSDLPEFVNELHQSGRYFVPILDPAVSAVEEEGTDGYAVYKRGMEKDVFVKNESGDPYLTRIWNPVSLVPDFTHANVCSWWADELRMFYEKVPFDGIWIDMNEPCTLDHEGVISSCDPTNPLNRPQYNPIYPQPLEQMSICMSSRHNLGPHYNIHNMYSLFESLHTYLGLQDIRKESRQFILSRATTTGQGQYTAHWTGDIDSSWDHMRLSVSSILDFNLFGIPLVGADICGFLGNTTSELCTRWSALGAFYPFARNHNDLNNLPQDPASMGANVAEAARVALQIRYQLLPYLYTLFYKNSLGGDPVVRSLQMNFPDDANVHAIDTQFMWGTGLLINPVLEEGAVLIEPYFPAGIWYDYTTGYVISNCTEGQKVRLNAPIGEISVATRGGEIIAVKAGYALNTADHKNMTFDIIVSLDVDGNATGQLYWDNGDGVDTIDRKEYFLIDFTFTNYTFTSTPVAKFEGYTGNMGISNVNIWVAEDPYFANVVFVDESGKETICTTIYNVDHYTLTVVIPAEADLRKPFQVKWNDRP